MTLLKIIKDIFRLGCKPKTQHWRNNKNDFNRPKSSQNACFIRYFFTSDNHKKKKKKRNEQ